jgi:FeS assembly SUF system protein
MEQAQPQPPSLEQQILDVLKTCYDPEIPVDVYELGLIYKIDASADGDVVIEITLTSPACPSGGSLPPEVERTVSGLPGVRSAKVNVVWEPIWTLEKMSETAKPQLGKF